VLKLFFRRLPGAEASRRGASCHDGGRDDRRGRVAFSVSESGTIVGEGFGKDGMTNSKSYTLAPPGAGLPRGELYVARMLFAWRRWTGRRESYEARFARERTRIRSLLENFNTETGSQRVLIARMPGLEDSSRDWSVWMTLEHLRIVHELLAQVIGQLVQEVTPLGETSIAAVKPRPDVGPEVVAQFEASCDAVENVFAASPNLNTRARYLHPWFGLLNAAGWHALAGPHMGIHRVQIERILAGLPRQS
jgi:hypothetical protein